MINKVARAGIGYTVGNYFLKGLSFFTIPIFARLLSTEDYGIVNTFSAYESILFVLIGLAIHSSFKNARYKFKDIGEEGVIQGFDYKTYVSNAYFFICLSGLVWLLAGAVFRNEVSEILKIDEICVLLLIVGSAANAIVVAYNTNVSIYYQYKKFLSISFFNAFSNITLSIVLIMSLFSSQKYLGRIYGIVIPIALAAVYILVAQITKYKIHNFIPMLKWGIKYSLPIVPHGISQIILSSFDRVMITRMVSLAATGLYSFAYNIFAVLQVTANSLDTVWSPWFYEKMHGKDYKSIKQYSSAYILFLAVICNLVMLISPELILLLGGEKYQESVNCVIPIIAGGFFAFIYNIPAAVEYYYERTRSIAFATTTAAVLNIVLNYFCIKQWGYVAAAYTTLLTYMFYFIFHYYMAFKIHGNNLFSNRNLLISCGMVFVCGIGSINLINDVLIRWMIAIFLFLISSYWGYNKFHLNKYFAQNR